MVTGQQNLDSRSICTQNIRWTYPQHDILRNTGLLTNIPVVQ